MPCLWRGPHARPSRRQRGGWRAHGRLLAPRAVLRRGCRRLPPAFAVHGGAQVSRGERLLLLLLLLLLLFLLLLEAAAVAAAAAAVAVAAWQEPESLHLRMNGLVKTRRMAVDLGLDLDHVSTSLRGNSDSKQGSSMSSNALPLWKRKCTEDNSCRPVGRKRNHTARHQAQAQSTEHRNTHAP